MKEIKHPTAADSSAALFLLRVICSTVGLWVFISLTHGLIKGRISYSVGEIDAVTVTTSGFWDSLPVYLMFCPVFGAGLIIAGFSPRLFVTHRWLWKVLLAVSTSAYLFESVAR